MSEREFISSLQSNQGIIHKVCIMYCDDVADREDLFQEIVINAWNGFPRFKQEARFSTWLYQIALNTAISWYRKNNKKSISFIRTDKTPIIQHDPWIASEQEEKMQLLHAAIATLNKVDKAVITLFLEDYDYTTIGEMLGISANNVGVKMNRIKNALKKHVQNIA